MGFGGEGVHNCPHFHTGNGEVNFDENGVKKATDELAFDPKSMEMPRKVDPMSALKFVTEVYPFRAGAQKTVVLFACSECTGEEVDYFDIQNKFLEDGIMLHVFTGNKVEVSGDQVAIGFNAVKIFLEDSSVSEELRSELAGPNDHCTVAAQQTHGTVWAVIANEGVLNKAAPHMVAEAEHYSCQVCMCTAMNLGARTVCQPCDMITPASLKFDRTITLNPFAKLRKLAPESLGYYF